MPIKGLSDQLRLPRLGKIRLGEKVEKITKQGKKVEFPRSLDYFVVPEEVKKVYGDKPRQLDIMFPTDDEEAIFPQYYKRYGSQRGLKCRGDGQQAVEITDDGRMIEIECPGKDCPYFQSGECKAIGNLHVLLWKVPGLGVYQIDTSSINSILNINNGLRMIRGMFGRIMWIPLVLKVEMQEAHPVVNGKRIATTIPVMSITANVSVEKLIEQVREKQKKGELPIAPAEIVNPEVDEKPELLYPETEKTVEEEEKIETPEEVNPPEQKEEYKEKLIQELFEKLNYPPVRQRLVREKFGDNKEALIVYLQGELNAGKEEKDQLQLL